MDTTTPSGRYARCKGKLVCGRFIPNSSIHLFPTYYPVSGTMAAGQSRHFTNYVFSHLIILGIDCGPNLQFSIKQMISLFAEMFFSIISFPHKSVEKKMHSLLHHSPKLRGTSHVCVATLLVSQICFAAGRTSTSHYRPVQTLVRREWLKMCSKQNTNHYLLYSYI